MAEYIEREEILKNYQTICNGVECVRCPIRDKGHCKFEAYIRSIPAADVRPVVKSKWVKMKFFPDWECEKCGSVISGNTPDPWNHYYFCPNCGADMRGES